jgi:hypothetical protein
MHHLLGKQWFLSQQAAGIAIEDNLDEDVTIADAEELVLDEGDDDDDEDYVDEDSDNEDFEES